MAGGRPRHRRQAAGCLGVRRWRRACHCLHQQGRQEDAGRGGVSTNTTAVLEVDWAAIGIDPAAAGGANVTVTAPAIQGFQPATEFGTVCPDGVVPPVAVAPAK